VEGHSELHLSGSEEFGPHSVEGRHGCYRRCCAGLGKGSKWSADIGEIKVLLTDGPDARLTFGLAPGYRVVGMKSVTTGSR